MRVLFDYQIMKEQKYGGVSRYFAELISEMGKNNCRCFIPVLFSKNFYLHKLLGRKIYTYHSFVMNAFSAVINILYTFVLYVFIKPDVVHLTWNNPYMNWLCREKLVCTIHDMIHEYYMPELKKDIYFKKRAIYDSRAIIAISENTKQDILNFYPDIDETKIYVIHHGTNHLPAPIPVHEVEDMKYIIFVGRRNGYKNAQFFLSEVTELLKNDSELCVFFAGGGYFSKEEEDLIKVLDIERQVIQRDVNDGELAFLYKNARCFVFPSLYEGFGFPILEAFDNLCPVVCSNTSSFPEVAGNAALYFSPFDGEELRSNLQMAIYDDEIRKKMIEKGSKRLQDFTWEKTAKKTLGVYKNVVKDNEKN